MEDHKKVLRNSAAFVSEGSLSEAYHNMKEVASRTVMDVLDGNKGLVEYLTGVISDQSEQSHPPLLIEVASCQFNPIHGRRELRLIIDLDAYRKRTQGIVYITMLYSDHGMGAPIIEKIDTLTINQLEINPNILYRYLPILAQLCDTNEALNVIKEIAARNILAIAPQERIHPRTGDSMD